MEKQKTVVNEDNLNKTSAPIGKAANTPTQAGFVGNEAVTSQPATPGTATKAFIQPAAPSAQSATPQFMVPSPRDPAPKPGFSWANKKIRLATIIVAMLLAGGGSLYLAINTITQKQAVGSVATKFTEVDLPLDKLGGQDSLALIGTRSLVINGPLKANDSFIISPSAQPSNATRGQIYYDQTANQLAFFNGGEFVTLSNELEIGDGLANNDGTIANSGVLTLQGQAGNVSLVAGSGIALNGTTIANTGVISVEAGNAGITVTNDGAGNITISGSGGSGTVNSPGGTSGRIAKFTGVQTVADSLLSEAGTVVTVNGDLSVTGSLALGTALAVGNGGTGATSLTANGVLVGNGAGAITSVTAGGTGQCLLSTAGAPVFGACSGGSSVTSVNGLSGALTIANASGAGSTITIDDASTSQKGIAQFNATNFSASGGTINTIQNINTGASPTFTGLTLSGDLAVNGGDITSTGALNIASGGAGNDVTIDGADQFIVQDAAVFNALSTFTAGISATLADTENVGITSTVTGTNSVDLLSGVLTNSTSGGTQRVALLQNAAGTGTTESLLTLNNADTDTAVTAAIQFINGGGGFTNLFDVEGTLISGAEFAILDGGINLGTDTAGDYVASFTAGTGLSGDASGEGSTPTLSVNTASGIAISGDNVVLDTNYNPTWTADHTFALSGTENIDVTHDLGGTVNMIGLVGTPSASAGTTRGIFLQQASSANANGLDQAITIDNADTDLAITTGLVFSNSGGGNFTNIFDILGTTLTAGEVTVLDGGLDESEVSGTITDVTAGTGLTGGGAAGNVTLNVVSGNGGIVVSANDIALTVAASADALSATTSSGSGLEVLASGVSLLQGCSDGQVLKWNETTDVWACNTDSGGGNSFTTIGTPSGSSPVADSASDTLSLAATGANLTITGDSGADTVTFDLVEATLAGNGLAANGDAIDITTGNGLELNSDAVRVNQDFAFSWTNDHTFNLNGTENVEITSDFAGSVNMLGLVGTPNASAGTTRGIFIQQAASANANGLDSAVVIDNADTDLAITTGLTFSNSGGGNFTNIFDILGTTLTAGEVTVLDGGIDESEVTGVITDVTAGSGLTGGAASGNATVNVASGNGGIMVNANDISLTVTSSADALSSTTSSGSGLEILATGITMLQGCSTGQLLKWNETTDVWECSNDTDTDTTSNSFATFSTPAGTSPIADSTTDTMTLLATGTNLTITGSAAADSITFDIAEATLAGNGLAANGDALDVTVGNGLELNSDAVRVNQGFSFAWTADHTYSLSGAEDLAVTHDGTGGTADAVNITVAPSSTAGALNGLVINQAASANTNPLDAALRINNLDNDVVIPAAIQIANTGGGNYTDIIDVLGTGLSAAELTVLDGGITLGTETAGDYVASFTAGTGLSGDASGEGSTPTLSVNAASGVTTSGDNIVLDTNYNPTWTADHTFNLAGAENIDVTHDLSGTVNMLGMVGTPSASAGTTRGIFIQQATSANTNGLDQAIVIDNADADLQIAAAFQITNSGGGGYTNVLDILGTGLSAAELTVLDGGIDESEVTGVITDVTAGSGLTGGAASGNATVNVASGNGGIVVGADAITLTVAASADALSATTSSGSGLEVLASGVSLLQGCGDSQTLKWNETTDVWACATDSTGSASDSFATIGTPAGTNPVADSSTDTLTLADTGTNLTITGDSSTDTVTFDLVESALAGNGLAANGDALDITTGNGLELNSDAVRVNQDFAFTWTNDHTFNLNGTENVEITSDLAGSVSMIGLVGTPSASAGTTRGIFLQQAASANANGLDQAIVIDNADTDLAITTGLTFSNSGGGNFTNIFDILGTTLTAAEVTVLDGGLSETEVSGDIEAVTAGTGLTGGGAADSVTLNIASGNGGIMVNADDIALTVAASTDALSGTTSSGSGLEILATGVTLLQGCGDSQTLKWNETTDVWACATDSTGSASDSFATFSTPAGTSPVADSSTDTMTLLATGSNLSITGDSTADSITFDIAEAVLAGNGLAANGDALDVTVGNGLELNSDAVRVNQNFSFAWTADHTYSLAGTEDIAVSHDGSGGTADVFNITVAPSSSTGTLNGLVVNQAASANTNPLDAALKIDNLDNDVVIPVAIQIANTGGGNYTNIIDVMGVGISAAELTVLDGGITLGTETAGDYVASFTAGTGLTGDASGEGSAPTLSVNTSAGVTTSGDNVVLDTNYNPTWTADHTFNLAGAENIDVTHDLAGTVNMIGLVGTPSASAGTTRGIFLQQANSANTNGLDGGIVIDNADTDLAITSGLSFTNSGGGSYTNILDILGTGLSAAELTVLDGGLTESEVTGEIEAVTAGNGLTGGGAADSVSLAVASGNGGIVVNADDITLTVATSADALSATTSSGSGLEVLTGGLSLLQGCSDNQVLKWNETTDVWACNSDNGAGNTFETISTPAGTSPVADSSTDTLTLAATGSNLTITGNSTTDTITLDISESTLAGNGIAANGDALDVSAGNGIALSGDAVTVNQDFAFTWTNSNTFNLNGTENVDITSDLAGSVNMLGLVGTPSASAGTTRGIFLQQAASANTNGLDSGIVIDNADTDLAITDGISFTNSGGGDFTNIFNILGTALTAGEVTVLDGGIDESEVAGVITAVTAGNGVTGGGASGAVTVDVASANGGITINANDIALTVAPSADALSATTSSGSGLEILTTGVSLLQGCSDGNVLKWNETTDVWACAADTDTSSNSFATFSTPAGTSPVADSSSDTMTLLATGSNLTISGDSTADSITFDISEATLAGNGLSASGDALVVNAGNGIALSGDNVTVDQNFAFTWTADHTFNLNSTENVDITSDLAGSVNMLGLVGTPSASAGTTRGIFVQQANSANTNGLDAGFYLDNADADLPIAAAISIQNSGGGGYTTLIDNAGTLISGAELNLLDGHDVALVDTNDAVSTAIIGTGALNGGSITSGFGAIDVGADNITTTGTVFGNDLDRSTAGALGVGNTNATSVSICNSATCDAVTIGTNADADTITIGDSSDTVSINAGTGGLNLTATGDSLNLVSTKVASDAVVLNASANTGGVRLIAGDNPATALADGNDIEFLAEDNVITSLTAGGQFVINASTNVDSTINSTTGGTVNISIDAAVAAAGTNNGIYLNYQVINDANTDQTQRAFRIDFVNSENSGDTIEAFSINNADDASNGVTDALISLVNSEGAASTVTDGLVITGTAGAGLDTIVDAIDVSDDNITNGINLGTNFLVVSGDSINDFTGNAALAIAGNALILDATTTGTTATTSSNSGLEIGSDGVRLIGGCSAGSNDILKWNGSAWACAADNDSGGSPTLDSILAAAGAGAVQDSNANTIQWNWDFTSAAIDSGLIISESSASTSGTQDQQALLELVTLGSSTASPLQVTAGGTDVGDVWFDLTGASDFQVRDSGTTVFAVNDTGSIDLTPTANRNVNLMVSGSGEFYVTNNSSNLANITFDLTNTGDFRIDDNSSNFLYIDDLGGYSYTLDSTDNPTYTITNNGTGDVTTNLAGTGDFVIQDGGSPFVTFNDSGSAIFTLAAASEVFVDGGTTDRTADMVRFDVDVNSANVDGLYLDLDVGTALSAGEVANGINIDVTGLAGDSATSALSGINLNGDITSAGVVSGLKLGGSFDYGIYFGSATTTADIRKDTTSFVLDMNNASDSTFSVTNSGAGVSFISNTQGQTQSEAFGAAASVSSTQALAVGYFAQAGNFSVAVGSANTEANDGFSTVIGSGATSTGTGATVLGYSADAGANGIAIGPDAQALFGGSIALGADAATTATDQLVIGGGTTGISHVVIGDGVTSATPTSPTIQASSGNGTDVAGGSLSIAGGQGTGTGNGGSINFQIADPGTTGTSLNALTTVMSLGGAAGAALFQNSTDSTLAFRILEDGGVNSVFTADTSNLRVGIGLAAGTAPSLASAGLEIKGGLRLSPSSGIDDVYATPGGGGSTVPAAISVVTYDPGASGQILALGLASGSTSSARVVSLFDQRAAGHQATLAVFSPGEAYIGGFSWDGSDTEFLVTNSNASGLISLDISGSSVFTVSAVGAQVTGSFEGDSDVDFTLTNTENFTANSTVTGTNAVNVLNVALTNQTSSGTQQGLAITNVNDAANATTEALISLDNAETTASTLTDAILITSSGVADGIVDAIDVSHANITNGINLGDNFIVLSGDSINDFNGNGLTVSSNVLSVQVAASADALSATTSSGSGLEVLASGVALLQGCSDLQVLKWDETNDIWECAADNGTGTTPDFDEVYAQSITNGNLTMEIDNAGGLIFNMTTTGDFVVQDAGTQAFAVQDNGLTAVGNGTATAQLHVFGAAGSGAAGTNGIVVTAGDGASGTTAFNGGANTITSGNGGSDTDGGAAGGNGGALTLTSGTGGDSLGDGGAGGLVTITAGSAVVTSGNGGAGGDLVINAGTGGTSSLAGSGGRGGNITITAGTSGTGTTEGDGGILTLVGGASAGTAGYVAVKSATNSAAAFRVVTSTNAQVFGIGTTNGTLTIGHTALSGELVFHDGNGQTATISVGTALAASTVLAVPTTVGASDTFCLQTLANCGGAANFDDVYAKSITDGNLTMEIDNAGGLLFNMTTTGDFAIQDNGTTVFAVNDDGTSTFQSSTNAANAVRVLNSTGGEVLGIDTTSAGNIIRMLNNNSGEPAAWSTATNLTASKDNAAAVYANGYVYAIGGSNGTSTQNTIFYGKPDSSGNISSWTTNANNLNVAREYISAVTYNGYIYVLGGSSDALDVTTTVQYAKLNPDGSTGAWSTTSALPAARKFGAVVAHNGYIYYAGGNSHNSGGITEEEEVYSAKVNSDGTLAAFSATTSLPAARADIRGVVANGQLYFMGGRNNAGTYFTSIYHASPTSTGTVSAWTTEPTNTLPVAKAGGAVGVMNGYLYYTGGETTGATPTDTVHYAPFSSTGSIGTWTQQSTSGDLPATRTSVSFATGNGVMYAMGGWTGAAATNTVYYTSFSKVKVGGGLDLTAYSGENAADGGTGGELTAGNTIIAGLLMVTGNATFKDGASILGALNVSGGVTIGNSTDGFTFDPASGPLFSGTARPTKRVTLIPEYPGALLTPDGSSNTGTMTTDFCSDNDLLNINTAACPTNGDQHNYYTWVTTAQNDYDIYIQYQVPSDFSAFASDTTINMYGWRTDSTATTTVDLSLYEGATQCGTTTNVATGTATWTETALGGNETGCAIAAGDVITFRIRMSANNKTVRAGEIRFDYRAKF